MDVLKTYLETSVENEENKKRVMELQKRQESAKVSDLRRDIDYIKVRTIILINLRVISSSFLSHINFRLCMKLSCFGCNS